MTEQTSYYQSPNPAHAAGAGKSLSDYATQSGNGAGQGRVSANAVVSLIVKLEHMVRNELPPDRRIALLKVLVAWVLKVGEGLPKPVAGSRQSHGRGHDVQSLEQRLYRVTTKNLKATLEAFDRSPLAYTEGAEAHRSWLVRHLFLMLGREVEYCVRWERPWPQSMWRELHVLYLHLDSRRDVDSADLGSAGVAFDAEQEYKRLLLLGLARQVAPATGPLADALLEGVHKWTRESSLQDPGGFVGVFGLWVVEISSDEPPRIEPAVLEAGFYGWVLDPSRAFLSALAGLSKPA